MTLAGTSLFAITTVIFVHYTQQAEKAVCIHFMQIKELQTKVRKANLCPGNARRSHTGRGTATGQERKAARFRNAEGVGRRVQEDPECTGRRGNRRQAKMTPTTSTANISDFVLYRMYNMALGGAEGSADHTRNGRKMAYRSI